MDEFINTIDELGDDAVADSLIMRTIEVFKDNHITKLPNKAFYSARGYHRLKEIDLPECTSIGDFALYWCGGLTHVNFPKVAWVGNYGMASCTSLTTLDMPSLKSVGDYAFHETRLQQVSLPQLTAAGTQMLRGTQITSITLPSATSLGYCSLYVCPKLAYADFPKVNYINDYAMSGCHQLQTLILRTDSVATLLTSNSLSNTPIASGTGYVYVPRALVDSYKVATNWSAYADQFRALEDWTVDGTITGELDESKI